MPKVDTQIWQHGQYVSGGYDKINPYEAIALVVLFWLLFGLICDWMNGQKLINWIYSELQKRLKICLTQCITFAKRFLKQRSRGFLDG